MKSFLTLIFLISFSATALGESLDFLTSDCCIETSVHSDCHDGHEQDCQDEHHFHCCAHTVLIAKDDRAHVVSYVFKNSFLEKAYLAIPDPILEGPFQPPRI